MEYKKYHPSIRIRNTIHEIDHLDRKENKAALDFLKKVVKTYMDNNKYFLYGKWLKPPKIETQLIDVGIKGKFIEKVPAVQTSTWQANDGSMILVFINIADKEIKINYKCEDDKLFKKIDIPAKDIKIIHLAKKILKLGKDKDC